ncbi:tRNA (adenosine(37)-N6)-threonylcarbamoyltransferase complex ATPase subunit type 1 TsaE [Candidatus Parcubacteria bacterium 4484_255]|nr:MAG: tRNA (adenosine(37)-N6)-threonylcarbamoyltransferase complex ATPase subunit type 1 TsaE [Candidatus Parcubacteria bacterium 4484_255]
MEIITLSEKQTLNLGKKIAKQLKGGEIIALIGGLGAGKTIFAKGIANGLGIKKIITSPTFVLMKIYEINKHKSKTNLNESRIQKLCHIDAYRLKSSQALINIGINDYLGQKNTVAIIEWADQVQDILPKNAIFVKIKAKKKRNKRIITITKVKIKK